MDPFLENADTWPVFHHELVTALHKVLMPMLNRPYESRIGARRYLAEPVPGALSTRVEQHEEYVELYKANAGGLITLVDVISPANKLTDSGKRAYMHTRQQAKDSSANCVEIDLVLQGQPILEYSREGMPDFDYSVTVVRPLPPERFEIWIGMLDKRLPRFRVPTIATDRDIIVDLQSVFTQAYQQGGFAGRVDYRQEPDWRLKDSSRNRFSEIIKSSI